MWEERAAFKKLQDAAAEEQRQHPDATVAIWVMDEHREESGALRLAISPL